MNHLTAIGLILFLLESQLPYPAGGNYTSNGTVGLLEDASTNVESLTPTPPTSIHLPTTRNVHSSDPTPSEDTTKTPPPVFHNSQVRNYNWVVALTVLASAGIITVVGLEFYIQTKICGSNIMKDFSSQWLGHVLLFGIFLSYLLMYAFIPYPSPVTCAIIRFCVGVCYALCFAVIVVKLVVILCPGEVHTGIAILLFLFIWIVQIVIDIQWLIQAPPEVARFDNTDGYVCDPGFHEHVISLVYVMTLIVGSVCACALALGGKTRVGARQDVICIGLTCVFTVAVWLVWILLGYLKNDTEYHDPCLAFGLLVTVTAILLFVFVPKLLQLNKIDMFSLEAANGDVIKVKHQTPRKATKDDAWSVTSGSKRSQRSIDEVSSNGSGGYTTREKGRGRGRKLKTMETLYEDDESLPPDGDPFALHLQYPTSDQQPRLTRWGSIDSAPEGHETRLSRSTSSNSSTSREENHPSTANRSSRSNHANVNQNPKPKYSYEVSSSARRNNTAATFNHSPRPIQKSQNRF